MRFCFLVIGCAGALCQLEAAMAVQTSRRVVSVVRADPRTGRLVRSVVVTARPVPSRIVAPLSGDDASTIEVLSPGFTSAAMSNPNLLTLVEQTAKAYDVHPALVESVIQVESNGNPNAVSRKGAQGLMQLMPATARRFGVRNSFNPKENIEGGVKYLKFLQDTFKDDRLAIAAYNAGEGAVFKYNNVPPYPETMNYVARVGKRYGAAKRASDRKKAAQPVSAPKVEAAQLPVEEQPRSISQFVDAEGRVHITTQ